MQGWVDQDALFVFGLKDRADHHVSGDRCAALARFALSGSDSPALPWPWLAPLAGWRHRLLFSGPYSFLFGKIAYWKGVAHEAVIFAGPGLHEI